MRAKSNIHLAFEFLEDSVKFVKIRQTGEVFELLAAKVISIEPNADEEIRERLCQESVQKLLTGEDRKNNSIVVSINSFQTCFLSFVFPKLQQKEIAETIKWKIKDEIPFPLDEAMIDYRLFPITNETQNQYLALVAATPKEALDSTSRFLPVSKSKGLSYPTVCFSISRLAPSLVLLKEEMAVIVDIGDAVTEIAIYSDKKLSFLRKIAFGKQTLIDAMIQPLTSEKGKICLDSDEAKKAIHSENLFEQNNSVLWANKIEGSRLYALTRPEFEKLAAEITRSLDYFMQQHGKSVSQVYLTGELSRLKGLSDFLVQKLQTSIQILDLGKSVKILPEVENLNLFYRPISLILDRKNSGFSTNQSLEKRTRSLNLEKIVFTLIGVWLLTAGILGFRYYEVYQNQKTVEAEINNLKAGYEEAKKIEQFQSHNQKAKMVTNAILINEPNWTELFRELSNVFPNDVLLKSLVFDKDTLTMNGVLKIGDENAVSELLLLLEGPIFKNVTLISIEKKEAGTEFSIQTNVT